MDILDKLINFAGLLLVGEVIVIIAIIYGLAL